MSRYKTVEEEKICQKNNKQLFEYRVSHIKIYKLRPILHQKRTVESSDL